jgi:hypothetical protein
MSANISIFNSALRIHETASYIELYRSLAVPASSVRSVFPLQICFALARAGTSFNSAIMHLCDQLV